MKKTEKTKVTEYIGELHSRHKQYMREAEILNARAVMIQVVIEELEEIVNKIKD